MSRGERTGKRGKPNKPPPTRKPRTKSAKRAKPEKETWADVVAAVVRDGERVLVTSRPAGAHLGGHDEFPGGRREPGETLEQACVREVKEEVGLDVKVVGLLGIAWHQDAERKLALSFFECACTGPTELSAEVVTERVARWVDRRELPKLNFPPANRDVVKRLAG